MEAIYPTIPALESLPYDLNTQHQRLLDVMGEGNSAELSESQRDVFDLEVSRLTDILSKAQAMIERINSGNKAPSDSVDAVRNLINVLKSGVDGLEALAHKTSVLDIAKSYTKEGVDVLHSTYAAVKEEVENSADKVLGKSIGPAIWILAVLMIVLVIIIKVEN